MASQPPPGPPPLPGGGPPPLPTDGAASAPPPVPPAGGPPAGAGAAATQEEPRTHAIHHDTQATRTYPCATCGSQLVFDPEVQQLRCPSCGGTQALLEVRGTVQENDLRGAMAQMRTRAHAAQQVVAGEKEIVCQSCGGHTTFTGTWTAQRCPFCATPIQRDDVHDAPDRLPVDGILPFQIAQPAAEEALQKWVSSRWFAPSEFKDYSRAGSFSSVYIAHFTYDAEATTRYTGQRGDDRTVTVGSGEDQRTETVTDWRHVSGMVHNTFDDVTILANEGLDRGHCAALQPWPMERVQPFSPEFVAGHLSRTYDHDVEACLPEARKVMDAEIDRTIRRDIGGDHQRISTKDTAWGMMTFKHVLLPIWLLTVMYDGRAFQVMINGATGEVHGERPYSKIKIAAAVLLALIVIAVGVVLFGRGG